MSTKHCVSTFINLDQQEFECFCRRKTNWTEFDHTRIKHQPAISSYDIACGTADVFLGDLKVRDFQVHLVYLLSSLIYFYRVAYFQYFLQLLLPYSTRNLSHISIIHLRLAPRSSQLENVSNSTVFKNVSFYFVTSFCCNINVMDTVESENFATNPSHSCPIIDFVWSLDRHKSLYSVIQQYTS